MKNLYKNAMIDLIKSSNAQKVSGAQLVNCYIEVAAQNGRTISKSHIPLNVHKFAKRYGQKVDVVKTLSGRTSTLYMFNF
jgi:hypothetical protein